MAVGVTGASALGPVILPLQQTRSALPPFPSSPRPRRSPRRERRDHPVGGVAAGGDPQVRCSQGVGVKGGREACLHSRPPGLQPQTQSPCRQRPPASALLALTAAHRSVSPSRFMHPRGPSPSLPRPTPPLVQPVLERTHCSQSACTSVWRSGRRASSTSGLRTSVAPETALARRPPRPSLRSALRPVPLGPPLLRR